MVCCGSVVAESPTLVTKDAFAVFPPASAKGGCEVNPTTTAVVFIEYQHEFTSEGGKLHPAVKDVMQSTNMLENSANVAKVARECGSKVFHVPISLIGDGSDNPNKGLGILAGCQNDSLFVAGTWNAEICAEMAPLAEDIVIKGKRGLDGFPGTDLEQRLKECGIETVVLAGFLTNCCVESTMRTAYEKGFNVITLTDCCATTDAAGQTAACTGTFGMFSKPMASGTLVDELRKRMVTV